MNNNEVKSSGEMRSFKDKDGNERAHRDGGDKGLPTDAPAFNVAELFQLNEVGEEPISDPFIYNIGKFQATKDRKYLYDALYGTMETIPEYNYDNVIKKMEELGMPILDVRVLFKGDEEKIAYYKRRSVLSYMMLEVAYLYEAGGNKYGRNNWRKGMPLDVYLCSALRHYYKCLMFAVDEPHYRAVVWNILGALWTIDNDPTALEEFVIVK